MKKIFQKISFCLSILSFSYLYSIEHQKILNLVAQKFDDSVSGLVETINSKNSGKWFELESALFVEKLGESVEGFGLTIDVYNLENKKIYVPIGDKQFEIKTTDYDIVTKDYVFECKSTKEPEKYVKIKQFLKERDMLLFFKNVCEEFKRNTLRVSLSFSKRKKRSILTINGKCTGYQDVSIMCSWVKSRDKHECAAQWGKIIKILASKSLVVMLKSLVNPNFVNELEKRKLIYYENVNYENVCHENAVGEISLKEVIDSFENLVIC